MYKLNLSKYWSKRFLTWLALSNDELADGYIQDAIESKKQAILCLHRAISEKGNFLKM